ncbi:MAG: hypothetical protein KQI35_01175 [Bacteroidetes bacterium]|nr:hypothetical protein [Bacteroidota bacterium]
MKIYAIEQSNAEVKKAYGILLDRINEHIKLLAENRKPITSIVGIKRGLLRLKIGISEEPTQKVNIKLPENLEILAGSFMEKYQIDIKEIIDVGLVGEKEIIKALVKKEYDEMAKQGKKYKDIKAELSGKYGLSVSSIEKLVYRDTPRPAGTPLKGRQANTQSKNKKDG